MTAPLVLELEEKFLSSTLQPEMRIIMNFSPEELKNAISAAEAVVVGIGAEFQLKSDSAGSDCDSAEAYIADAYNRLNRVLADKNYFILTTCTDGLIYRSELEQERIAAPSDKLSEQQDDFLNWDKYTGWLQRTLNRKLVLLELGAGFLTPTVIRWPFEKIAMLNNKAMLYRVNEKFPQLPEEIKGKGVAICENSLELVKKYF